ncbi:hypothetical protein Tco_0275739 [Tanacetum coccineum]
MSHISSSHADVSANKPRRTLNYSSYPYLAKHLKVDSSIDSESELEVSGSCEIKIQVATWLKTFEEFTRGWVRLGCLDVDTQMTWTQSDYREIWVESRNAGVLFLSYQILFVLVVGRYTNDGVLVKLTCTVNFMLF